MIWPEERALFDSAVFVYAMGQAHPLRDGCRALVSALGDGRARGEASIEAIQEVVHQRWRRTGDRTDAARRGWQVYALVEVHECGDAELRRALDLFHTAERLQLRDAIHAATALTRGVSGLISPDSDFDEVHELHRLDPRDAAGRL